MFNRRADTRAHAPPPGGVGIAVGRAATSYIRDPIY